MVGLELLLRVLFRLLVCGLEVSSGLAKSFGGSTVTLTSQEAPLVVLVRHGLRVLAWQQGQRGNDLISVNGKTVSVLVQLRHSFEKNFRILFDCY